MNIDISNLVNGIIDSIDIDTVVSFDKEMIKNTSLLELNNVNINGSIYVDTADLYHIDMNVKGKMVLPCSITLKPVDYAFSCVVSEEYDAVALSNMKKNKNSIDILPIIWENIILEIPLRVLASDAYDTTNISGDGWKLVTDTIEEGEE